MKQTVNKSAFVDAFRSHNRYDQFGDQALGILFDYFEEIESDTGVEMERDVIAICCEYAVDTVDDIASNYSIDVAGMDDDEKHDAVLEYLNENTQVCGECDYGIVYCTAF